MSIIRVIGSVADLDVTLNMTSTTSGVDANIAKEGFTGTTSTPTSMARINIDPVSELWVNWRQNHNDLTNSSSFVTCQLFDTTFSTTQALFRLTHGRLDTDGAIIGQYWNGSAWTSIGTGPFSSVLTVEETLYVKMDNVSGIFRRYRNTVLDGELLGDTIRTAGTVIDRIQFETHTGTGLQIYSEVIIATTDTRGRRLQRLEPTADGVNTAWTGTFADVDEVGINDADYISTTSADQLETFVVADIAASLASAFAVEAVVASVRARKGETGPQNLQAVVRTASTDYTSSNISGLNTVFRGGLQKVWDTNPNTLAAWTQAEVNGLEIGVKSIA